MSSHNNSSSRRVILVGTFHHFQIGRLAGKEVDPKDIEAFSALLTRLLERTGAGSLLEELSLGALNMADVTESSPSLVAKRLGLSHAYCDPDTSERRQLGISDDQHLEIAAWRNDWSASRLRAEVSKAHSARELVWLSYIQGATQWPIVFVCGADHVLSFKQLLLTRRYAVQVFRRCWMPRKARPN